MEFELSQFSDDLLDPAPKDQDTPPVDESVAHEAPAVEPETVEEPESTVESATKPTEDDSNLDAYTRFLKSRGVRDGKTIVYEDEDTGETSEVDFSTLTADEQFSILNELANPGFTEDEFNTIAYLRSNNATLQDVIDYYSDQAVKQYIEQSQNSSPTYAVDQYSDDELYLSDLKSRYSNMTDEELINELESAKMNEELFNKKVETIKERFKQIEEEEIKQKEAEQKRQEGEYYNSVKNTLDQFNYIPMDYKDPQGGVMQVETSEKAAIWDYLFLKDSKGMTGFTKDLQDPSRVIEMAWRMLYGSEAMSDMTKYWKNEIKKSRRAAEPSKPKTSTTTVVKNEEKPKSAFDNNDHTSLNPGWGRYL